MYKFFGTDGIRGLAGTFPLDERTVRIIGSSLARQFYERLGRHPRFITGRDTRESGSWIEKAFHAGMSAEQADCLSAGVITTPGVAFLTKALDLDAGIVISASHNPFQDNGIKIFSPSGKKIDGATELAIESDIIAGIDVPIASTEPTDDRAAEFRRAYLDHLKQEAGNFNAEGLRIVVDCANGAASELAPRLFAGLGADVVAINAAADGSNINKDCGSLHLEGLQAKVIEDKADLGIAFDGDADRALFVDENGNIVDGDATMWILSGYLKSHGKLTNSTVVATVMSNIGLEIALKAEHIELLRTSVGDKYVLEKLLETDGEIGGEQSGHIILPEISLVGDGMMTALLVLRSIIERKLTLSHAVEGFSRFPQILLNVKVREKQPFEEMPEIMAEANLVENELHGEGRLLLRYSGTENLARVMIEGRDQAAIESQAGRLVDVIKKTLG